MNKSFVDTLNHSLNNSKTKIAHHFSKAQRFPKPV